MVVIQSMEIHWVIVTFVSSSWLTFFRQLEEEILTVDSWDMQSCFNLFAVPGLVEFCVLDGTRNRFQFHLEKARMISTIASTNGRIADSRSEHE